MKHLFLTIAFIILSNLCIYAQESKEKKKYHPEIMLSVNRTAIADGNMHDRFGFGAGIYHSILNFNQKRNHLLAGLEYNRNSLFVDFMSTNDKLGSGYHEVTYTINNIGIPVFYRFNMGKESSFFLEAGAFVDLSIFGSEKGRYKEVISDNQETDYPIDDKILYKMPNFGLQGGAGWRIFIQEREILLKGDYKWGMRNIFNSYNTIHNRYWRISVGIKVN